MRPEKGTVSVMPDYTKTVCPVCGQAFGPEDDVVVCPLCGAPHHRACFKQNGRCAFAADHGTPRQWTPAPSRGDEDARICGNCGTANPPGADICACCGYHIDQPLPPGPAERQPPIDASVFYAQFSPYVGIAPDSLIDGHPAMDVASFLGPNAGFYLSRFHFMRVQRNKISWNWAAALFPAGWLLYRKMYKAFILVFLLSLLLALPGLLIAGAAARQFLSDPAAVPSYWAGALLEKIDVPAPLALLFNIATTLHFFFRLVMASRSNHIYRRHTMSCMAGIRAAYPDDTAYRRALVKKGGVSRRAVLVYILLLAAAASTSFCLLAFYPLM